MGMSFSEAKDAAKRGRKIRRNAWGESDPAYIIYVEAKITEAKKVPISTHVGQGTPIFVSPHFDAIFETDTHKVLVEVGYNFHLADLTADDWYVV